MSDNESVDLEARQEAVQEQSGHVTTLAANPFSGLLELGTKRGGLTY